MIYKRIHRGSQRAGDNDCRVRGEGKCNYFRDGLRYEFHYSACFDQKGMRIGRRRERERERRSRGGELVD